MLAGVQKKNFAREKDAMDDAEKLVSCSEFRIQYSLREKTSEKTKSVEYPNRPTLPQ